MFEYSHAFFNEEALAAIRVIKLSSSRYGVAIEYKHYESEYVDHFDTEAEANVFARKMADAWLKVLQNSAQ